MDQDKISWRYYPSNNHSGVYYVCKRGKDYIGQYQIQPDGRIVAHSIKQTCSFTDVINTVEARKYIITGEEPICKPPVVPKQQLLPALTHEQELARQQRMAGDDDDDDEARYNNYMQRYGY